jgi:8-oxo-dGTP pyrophosphatase MutT (NUDIX family)
MALGSTKGRPDASASERIPIQMHRPAGLWTRNDYIRYKLEETDAENFAAAGILVLRPNGSASLEMLFGRSSSENQVDFLGGKRDEGEDIYSTASREFDEETGGVLAEIKTDSGHRSLLAEACRASPVLWYHKGKYALFLVQAVELCKLFGDDIGSLPERHRAFMRSCKQKSFDFQEMQKLMWIPFDEPRLRDELDPVRTFVRGVFISDVFKEWLTASIRGEQPSFAGGGVAQQNLPLMKACDYQKECSKADCRFHHYSPGKTPPALSWQLRALLYFPSIP